MEFLQKWQRGVLSEAIRRHCGQVSGQQQPGRSDQEARNSIYDNRVGRLISVDTSVNGRMNGRGCLNGDFISGVLRADRHGEIEHDPTGVPVDAVAHLMGSLHRLVRPDDGFDGFLDPTQLPSQRMSDHGSRLRQADVADLACGHAAAKRLDSQPDSNLLL